MSSNNNTNIQEALFLESKQGKFVVRSRSIPNPGPGQLLVKVLATGLNQIDWKIQKYGIIIERFPAVLGTDIAGEVEVVGKGVTSFKRGDRVLSHGTFNPDFSSFQQYTLTNAEFTSKIPAKFSHEDGATIPSTLAPAYVGLYNNYPYGLGLAKPTEFANQGKYAGKPMVVLGGASSVGQFTIQLAKLSGFSPIITTASLKHTEFLKSIGATHIFDRNLATDGLRTEIENLTKERIDVVYDAISSPVTQQTAHDLLVPDGTLVTTQDLEIKKSPNMSHIAVQGVPRLPQNRKIIEELYAKLSQFLEQGAIIPHRSRVLPGGLEGIIGGLKELEEDRVSGVKLVAQPWET